MSTHESHETYFEAGQTGRLFAIRLKPNEDMITGIEQACAEAGVKNALVRSAVGSLVDAALGYGEGETAGITTVEGPGIEILSLTGEVREDDEGVPRAYLQGTISDSDAKVYGGFFLKGANAICITLELVLQEWLPAEA